jgi:hypothetical protein
MKRSENAIQIQNVVFTAAKPEDVQTGHLGWISFVLAGSLKIDGITLRRSLSGRLTLSFPARTDRCGRRYFILRPLGDEARREIERQVFAAIRIPEDVA